MMRRIDSDVGALRRDDLSEGAEKTGQWASEWPLPVRTFTVFGRIRRVGSAHGRRRDERGELFDGSKAVKPRWIGHAPRGAAYGHRARAYPWGGMGWIAVPRRTHSDLNPLYEICQAPHHVGDQ